MCTKVGLKIGRSKSLLVSVFFMQTKNDALMINVPLVVFCILRIKSNFLEYSQISYYLTTKC